jgi:hypothetical protein
VTLLVALVWCFAQFPAPAPASAVIYDYRDDMAWSNKARPPLPQPTAQVRGVTTRVSGVATRYAYHQGQAAAGPALRKALGKHWRGDKVDVCKDEACVTVRLTDFCACGDRHGQPTVIDLDNRDFAKLAHLGAGVIDVRVYP